MIRIERGAEPEGLEAERAAGLAAIRQSRANRALRSEDFRISKAWRDLLASRQRDKCCYCEVRFESALYNPVEHFRPKTRAQRGEGYSTEGYWWLAWTWDNLLFACNACNTSFKRDQFPLFEGCTPLAPEQTVDAAAEDPKLIDPGREDPTLMLRFQRIRRGRRTAWVPVPRSSMPRELERARASIATYGLDREPLIDLYTRYVNETVRGPVTDFLARVGLAGEHEMPEVQREWRRVIRMLLHPARMFVALARDALEELVPAEVRERWQLTLPEVPVPAGGTP